MQNAPMPRTSLATPTDRTRSDPAPRHRPAGPGRPAAAGDAHRERDQFDDCQGVDPLGDDRRGDDQAEASAADPHADSSGEKTR